MRRWIEDSSSALNVLCFHVLLTKIFINISELDSRSDSVGEFCASDMLQTWRLNSKGQDGAYQERAFDRWTARRPIIQQACNNMLTVRLQLRCSSERTGCFRCKTLSRDCVYSQSTARGSARARKNKEVVPESDDDSRHVSVSAYTTSAPSAPSVPTPSIDTKLASPYLGPSVSDPGPSSTWSNPALFRPEDSPGKMASLGVGMMSLGLQDYLSMQSISTMPMAGLETYQGGDEWLLPWPKPAQEGHLASAEIPWEGAAMPFSLSPPSSGGWGPGACGYGETPTTVYSITEPTEAEEQTSPFSLTQKEAADQRGSGGCTWPHPQEQESCRCLQRVVFSLEEIDMEAVDMNTRELGSWLSRHKEALRCGEALLACLRCRAKPEHMTILALLTDRLIAMCDAVVSAYLSTLAGNLNHEALVSRDVTWLVRVGNFEIDSLQEWGALVSTMLVMQLREFDNLMVGIKDLLRSIGGERAQKKAEATQSRVLALLEKLGSPQQDQSMAVIPPPEPRFDCGRRY